MLIRIFLLNMLLSISTFATDLPGAPGYLKPHSDAFLEPMVITKPGTEYGDAFRCYQGVPAIEHIAKGRLWAAWYSGGIGENRFNYIMLATSRNNDETWSDVKLVVDSDCTGTVPGFDSSSYLSNDQIGVDPRTSGPRRVDLRVLVDVVAGVIHFHFGQAFSRPFAVADAVIVVTITLSGNDITCRILFNTADYLAFVIIGVFPIGTIGECHPCALVFGIVYVAVSTSSSACGIGHRQQMIVAQTATISTIVSGNYGTVAVAFDLVLRHEPGAVLPRIMRGIRSIAD